MTSILAQAALLVTTGGLLVFICGLAVTRRFLPPVALLLDFLTAAGLIRLAGRPSWEGLASIAIIIALRRAIAAGLRLADASIGPGRPG